MCIVAIMSSLFYSVHNVHDNLGDVGIQSHHYAMFRRSWAVLCVLVWQRWPMSRGDGVTAFIAPLANAWAFFIAWR